MEDSASSISHRIAEFLRSHLFFVILFSAGIVLLSIGLMQYIASGSTTPIEFEKGSEVEASEKTTTQKQIMVDVSGAVLNPGVYKLSANSRIQDALIAAGGLSGEADREYVSKRVNLAQSLHDGEKVYIPSHDEGLSLSSSSSKEAGTLNINTASLSELDSLPGVGKATAEKIINARPYSKVEELLEKKVVSASVFEKIKDSISPY